MKQFFDSIRSGRVGRRPVGSAGDRERRLTDGAEVLDKAPVLGDSDVTVMEQNKDWAEVSD